MRKLCVALGIAMSVVAMAGSAQWVSGAARAAAPAAAAGAMSDSAACQVVKRVMPLQVTYTFALRKEGLVLNPGKREKTVEYGTIEKLDFSPGAFFNGDLFVHTKNPKATYHLMFPLEKATNETDQQLERALLTLAESARSGHTVVCSDDMREYADELAEFQAKTAAWRALAEKPKVGDEVYKDRLLAEDAVKNRDLNAAARYYEAGVQAEPTWDQGWYNAALVYADLNDYFDAALCMKHYIILMPNAADAQAAKNNIILWEAKADEAAGK